jgi:diguanylate cyclase (GGDEF)-like protein/PAS domain S-box-containing protein
VQQATNPEPTRSPLADATGRRPVILVVDDVPDNLAAIADMVRSCGAEVRIANSGAAALRIAALSPRPEIILLDIMMPGMDGYQVIAALRNQAETRDIPVIFVTALDNTEDEERGLEAGAVDYITKPINAAVLVARVRTQLELKHTRDMLAGHNEWLEREVKRRVRENTKIGERLQMALEAAGFGIWEHDLALGLSDWSPSLSAILDLKKSPATIAECLELVHPEDRLQADACFNHTSTTDSGVFESACRLRHRDGHWIWLEIRGRVVRRDENGNPLLSLGTMSDINLRKTAEADRQLADVVFRGINDGFCVTDPLQRIELVNEAFTRITGYSAAEVIGKTPSLLRSGMHGSAFYSEMWKKLEQYGNWQGEITNRCKDGALVTEWLSISAVRDENGSPSHYVGVFSDLSERKAAAERIQYLSNYDVLTALPNRNLFADRIDQAVMSAHRFERNMALILLDLDRFRLVNDSIGPAAGDQVLIQVAQRLNAQVREGDTVGRRGPNEFGFVMASIAHERDVLLLAQRLLESIAQPFEIDGRSIVITACIGICVAPKDGESSEALIRCADTALRRAKEAGNNNFRFYSAEMDADASRRLALEIALHDALAKNELTVCYQPQLSLGSGNVIGMEALLRWKSAQFGNVSPAEFIPIAEESGLIIAIGEWVLRTACAQTRIWIDLDIMPLRVAVNLSVRQFRQANLVAMVSDALAQTHLAPGTLELEITESAFIDNVDDAIAMCHKLKAIGVKLSLDDFGTGYSSLSYISRFPFDKIKIDQAFIRDITENPVNAAIATAAIVMARSLNLTVLAEGVETDAQASFLRSRRCDAMQGFLFSRALTSEEFTALLLARRQLPINQLPPQLQPTLLLVDDEANVLNSLKRLFRREGYQVLTAESPSVGLELLATNTVHVVLCDQRMPEMTGSEFLARVRQLYPDTVRIVLTGYADVESVTKAVNQGAIFKFLTKPWDDDLLRDQIREAFRIALDLQQLSAHAPQ